MPRQLFELKLKGVATYAKRGFKNLRCSGLPHPSKIQALFIAPLLNEGGEEFLRWVTDSFRWILEVVLRPEVAQGFVLLPKRWTVERTYGWLHWCRRLNVDYERLPASSEAFIHIAMIRLMLRRLA